MFPRRAGLITLLLVSAASLAEDVQQTRGADLVISFKAELKAALQKGLRDGPVNAISACNDRAPAISKALSLDGVQIGRTSHRLRNPDNVAPAWVNGVLRTYLETDAVWKPKTLKLDGGREGYVEPIVTQPLCLACHGETLAPDVASAIQRLYPTDQATGFKAGELRGVFWVDYPTSKVVKKAGD
jgi:hypothetical protein